MKTGNKALVSISEGITIYMLRSTYYPSYPHSICVSKHLRILLSSSFDVDNTAVSICNRFANGDDAHAASVIANR